MEPGGKADACLYAGLHVLVLAMATYYYYYYSYSCGCCYYCYTTAAVLEVLPGCRQNEDLCQHNTLRTRFPNGIDNWRKQLQRQLA